MSQVWKYPLNHGDNFVPVGKVVLVGIDPAADPMYASPCVWIEPDETGDDQQHLVFYGTGHDIPSDAEHVGSVICGFFVWHVYRLATAEHESTDE